MNSGANISMILRMMMLPIVVILSQLPLVAGKGQRGDGNDNDNDNDDNENEDRTERVILMEVRVMDILWPQDSLIYWMEII